jgi:hypothetical protein
MQTPKKKITRKQIDDHNKFLKSQNESVAGKRSIMDIGREAGKGTIKKYKNGGKHTAKKVMKKK